MREINLNRQLLGLEDLEFGTGTVEQTRAGTKVNITKINAGNLPFDETRTLFEFTQAVNIEELGNSVEAINNLNNDLDKILIVEDNLPAVNSIAQNIVPNLTEILNVDTLASQVTQDKASVSSMKLAVETLYDIFDDRFLGTKTVDPTLDNDGNALIDGAIYFNTSSNIMKVYNVGTTTWYSIPQIYLSALLDVQLTSLSTGHMLKWNGSKWINYTITKSDIGLSNVDNTSDIHKPISNLQNDALALKAPLVSAALVNPTINGIAQSGYTGFKNYIINGAFDICQRGTTAAISGDTYLVDRFHAWHSTGGTLAASQGPTGLFSSLKVAGSSSGAATVGQRIEACNSIKLGNDGNSKVTVSMYVKSNVASSGALVLAIPATTDNFITTTTAKVSTISFTTGWAKVSATFDLDFVYWGGFEVYMQCDICTDLYTTGWQVERGSVATPFDTRPYGLELSLCQRYYEKGFFSVTAGTVGTGTVLTTNIEYKVTKRITPTVTYIGVAYNGCSDISTNFNTVALATPRLTVSTGGYAYANGIYTSSAEL